ncbi:MAG: hypothetical protein J1E34_07515 [Oscillospiraceae bacterium]|nr:hypothetical protein [Oscillospiraceae bacterium]
MIYRISKTLHKNFNVFEKNKLPPRAYAIPYSEKNVLAEISYADERYSSDIVECLNGEWDFRLYKSIGDLPDALNSDKVKFGKLEVPSDWQRKGLLPPVYLNCPYEFDTMEPEIPKDMPVGVYRKFINIENEEKTYIISFLGVANNIALYVNGNFAGYSEGSHNTAEFDITPLLKKGENELLAVSFKWCNGTFIECQDMFRENGIFRDVLLYKYDIAYIYDYEINTEKTENGYSLKLSVFSKGNLDGGKIDVELKDTNGKTVCNASVPAEEKTELLFENINATEWNPEIPTVYEMYITLSCCENAMTVRNITGFKTIEIDKNIFKFNCAPIKMKGVNHHDSNLYKGYVMTHEDLENDIKLMKKLNVNAVRTSHYPPDPYLLTLCDIYGLYVVDEADIETHGCNDMAGDFHYISKQAKWIKHYVDRVRRMYYRDRNHPSITMWSLGNEAGGHKCQDACYKFLKETGTKIPVHYESVVHTKRFHYDVISEMYTSTEEIELMMKGKRKRGLNGAKEKICKEYSDYPFFLCEYCHAMGVGPGNLEEYWDLFYEWDNSMGGCIWEWADHTVYHPQPDKKYKYLYTYGGDHGEKKHDGHFCVDGLMYADRSLHTGAKEMKVVYRPIRASLAGEKLYCFENTNRFKDSKYIDINWLLLENGVKIDEGKVNADIAPMQAQCVEINHKDITDEKDYHINFIYTDKETGEEIAVEQITLNDVPYEYDIEIGQKISAQSENGIVTVKFENGECVFSGKTGELTSYVVNGKELLAENAGFAPNLGRAYIDNDAKNLERWEKAGLNKLKKTLKSFNVSLDDAEVIIDSVFALKANRKELYEVKISYVISSLGAIEVYSELQVTALEAETDIPRFGLMIELDRGFENAEYYGRGEAENMPDFKAQAPVGIYSDKIENMREKYVYPQESGMHCDAKWIRLTDESGNALNVYSNDSFNFSLRHFTQNLLNSAAHEEDLRDMNITLLSLDGATRGIGSSSCGPDTRAEYRLNALEGYNFSFTLIPEIK